MLVGMKTFIQILFRRMASALRQRWYLQLAYLALQHQLERQEPATGGIIATAVGADFTSTASPALTPTRVE